VSPKLIPIVDIEVRLIQDASQRTDRDLMLSWNNRGIHKRSRSANELDVAAFLTELPKACELETTLDLAKRLRLKPPQPQPRLPALLTAASRPAPRNAAREPPSSSPALRPRSRPDSRRRLQDTAPRTNRLHARLSLRTVASCSYFHTLQPHPPLRFHFEPRQRAASC
jgi:hypothetical protein